MVRSLVSISFSLFLSFFYQLFFWMCLSYQFQSCLILKKNKKSKLLAKENYCNPLHVLSVLNLPWQFLKLARLNGFEPLGMLIEPIKWFSISWMLRIITHCPNYWAHDWRLCLPILYDEAQNPFVVDTPAHLLNTPYPIYQDFLPFKQCHLY